MTPPARHAAAIAVLDRWLAGMPVEQALTNWARGSRFAGSGDRAAVRDLVYDAVRCRDSLAVWGGGLAGRSLILGLLRARRIDPASVFSGEGHAPPPLTVVEAAAGAVPEGLAALDVPAVLETPLRQSLGAGFDAVMARMQARAPLFLRVNAARATPDAAAAALAGEGIAVRPVAGVATALEVTSGARRVAGSRAYAEGLVEVQDAASQAAVALLPLSAGQRVLDYCAGGGGKSLAIAALVPVSVHAYDADPARMKDIPARAARAGVRVNVLTPAAVSAAAPFDLVLLDAPCSGSGAWRRQAEAKWTLTPEALAAHAARQAALLDIGAGLVRPGGVLAYMTCSLFRAENEDRTIAFQAARAEWRCLAQHRFHPGNPGDGFFVSIFRRAV